MFNIEKIKPQKQIFHNESINVYPDYKKIEEITFWEGNFRTLLGFDVLKTKFNKKQLSDISKKEIVDFLIKYKSLKLKNLVDSIRRNGIRVPIIALQDGTLLDGNRRYFACLYLSLKEKERPTFLDNIPVWIIAMSDATEKKKKKILAEANFVDDCKIRWTLDVQAQVIYDYYEDCKKQKMTADEIFVEITNVYSVKEEKTIAFINSIELTKEFIKLAKNEKEKNEYREIVQDKFLYFWEFWDKISIKALALDSDKEVPELKKLFFSMMLNERFSNFKQIEPMIRSIRDKHLWKMLCDSNGAKIDQVEALDKERKAVKSSEDKIRNFLKWLEDIADPSTFTKSSLKLLKELSDLCKDILKRSKQL